MSERVTAEELRLLGQRAGTISTYGVADYFNRAAFTIAALERERDEALGGVNPEIVQAAAIKWCGQKERETFPGDVEYFKHNWRALPGLRSFVLKQLRGGE